MNNMTTVTKNGKGAWAIKRTQKFERDSARENIIKRREFMRGKEIKENRR